VLQNVYISLPYIMAARTAGKIEKITSPSSYVYTVFSNNQLFIIWLSVPVHR